MAGRFCLRVFQSMVPGVAENAGLLFGLSYRLSPWFRNDFHVFLWSITSLLWIWLESKCALVSFVIFLTWSSDQVLPSSQPVYAESAVSIAVCTISEASTGICYYYCIYIYISLSILRRSKRQTLCARLQNLTADYTDSTDLHGSESAIGAILNF
jgi:hypothetical protein